MISFEQVSYKDLWQYVELGFNDDVQLMERYQQFKTPFRITVERNMMNIWDAMDGGYKFKFFKVSVADVPIGFTVLDQDSDMLFSFGINRKFRNQMITTAWFDTVKKYLTPHFTCSLWNENQRAIRFLIRNGMAILKKNETVTTLILS